MTKIQYFFTQVDTLTLWKFDGSKVESVESDIVKVPEQIMYDEKHEWPGLGEQYEAGDFIEQNTGERVNILGINLDNVEVIDENSHDIDVVYDHIKNSHADED